MCNFETSVPIILQFQVFLVLFEALDKVICVTLAAMESTC